MKPLAIVFAALLVLVAISAQADNSTPTVSAQIGALNAYEIGICPGQSSAVVQADNSGSPVMTLTVTTAVVISNSNYGQPFNSVSGIGGSYANTISSFPGKLYVTLATDQVVKVTATAYTSGSSVVTISCSAASPLSAGGGGSGGPVTIAAPTDGGGNVLVNPNGGQVTVANAITPMPAPTAPGASPTPAVPVVSENTCQFSTTLTPVTSGNMVLNQCGSSGETLVAQIGPSSAPSANNGNYEHVIDSKGNAGAFLCQKTTSTQCAGVTKGTQNGSGGLVAGLFPTTLTNASAASGTCTNISATNATMVGVYYASASAQTGTLTIYNEATAACTAADTIYVRATAGASFYDLWPITASAGLTYKWTTAAENGIVLIGYN